MDLLARLDRHCEKLDLALQGNLGSVHHEVRKFKVQAKKGSKRTSRVKDQNGLPASSFYKEKLIFREYFKAQLGGEEVSMYDLVLQDRQDIGSTVGEPFGNSASGIVGVAPGLCQLAANFSQSSSEAPGESTVVGHIARRFPLIFAAFFLPLI